MRPCLTCGSCASGQEFAFSFLQIPPRDGHPCCSARSSCHQGLQGTYTLKSLPGQLSPHGCQRQSLALRAMPGARRVGGDVATPTPRRPGLAGLPHPVPHETGSLAGAYRWMILAFGRGYRLSKAFRRPQRNRPSRSRRDSHFFQIRTTCLAYHFSRRLLPVMP